MTRIMTVRPAREDDVGRILGFVRELAEYEREPEAVRATEAMIHESLFGSAGGRAKCEAVIGEIDGVARGFALWFMNYSTWKGRWGLYLEDLYVQPPARGKGLGKALLVHLARIARERGCGRMEWAVLDWNTPAIEFYRSLGAQPMSEWTVYRLDAEGISRLARESGG
jgi:GNAT superfamily N-acetyltransferase